MRLPPESLRTRERGHDDSRVFLVLMDPEPDVRDAAVRMESLPIGVPRPRTHFEADKVVDTGKTMPAIELRWTERMWRSRSDAGTPLFRARKVFPGLARPAANRRRSVRRATAG